MEDPKRPGRGGVNRRAVFGAAAAAAAAPAIAAVPPAAPTGPAIATVPPRLPQGGTGPLRVLFVTSYHPFDRENLFLALDSLGQFISWTHVEHPAAEVFYNLDNLEPFDVLLFYDAFAGRRRKEGGGFEYAPPSAETQANLKRLTQSGQKGLVFFHHALSSWVHSWPPGVNGSNAYVEMLGGAADWGTTLRNIRGRDYPTSGFRQGTEQRLTIVDRNHPVTRGLTDFDIVDEPYQCPMFEDSVHCLIRTDFKPVVESFASAPGGVRVGANHAPGSNMAAWVKSAENTPLVYIQPGHDNSVWTNMNWRRLMLNAIQWTASPEAKAWARANPTRIFA